MRIEFIPSVYRLETPTITIGGVIAPFSPPPTKTEKEYSRVLLQTIPETITGRFIGNSAFIFLQYLYFLHRPHTIRYPRPTARSHDPAQHADPHRYSGEIPMRTSSEDVGYNFCANFKREASLSPRSLLRRSTTFPTGSLNCRT